MHNYWLAGTTGIVDYTNYDDMKYAVSYLFTSMDYLFILKEALHCVISNKYLNNFNFGILLCCRSRSLMTLSSGMHFPRDMFGYVMNLICSDMLLILMFFSLSSFR